MENLLKRMRVGGALVGMIGGGCQKYQFNLPKLPSKDNSFHSIVKERYDCEMDKMRFLVSEDQRIRDISVPSNDSAGY